MRTRRVFCRHYKFVPTSTDEKVMPNLAVTPAQMQKMTNNGVAVSSQGVSDFFDGEVNPSFDLPVDRLRGVDIVEVWESQKSSRKHINDHRDNNFKTYGEEALKVMSN